MKKNKSKAAVASSGFSIAWVSAFMILVSATITISLTTEVTLKNDKYQSTKIHMQEIEKALSAYLLEMDRLPCPAPLNATYTDDEYGVELIDDTSGNCQENDDFTTSKNIKTNDDLIIGAIPSETLGIARRYSVDGWGNKIMYVIDKSHTRKYISGESSMSGWKDGVGGSIIIKDNETNVETRSIYLLISYGLDGQGAFDSFGQQQNSLPLDGIELDNVCFDGYVDDIFRLDAHDIMMYHHTKNINSIINLFDRLEI